MANKGHTGGNKLKRKRGKKFRFYDGENANAGSKNKQVEENPFEEHSSSKKAVRDKTKVSIIVLIYIESSIDRRISD